MGAPVHHVQGGSPLRQADLASWHNGDLHLAQSACAPSSQQYGLLAQGPGPGGAGVGGAGVGGAGVGGAGVGDAGVGGDGVGFGFGGVGFGGTGVGLGPLQTAWHFVFVG